MPKISFEESNSYQSGGGFFGLQDDGDTAQVNFLVDNEGDIEVYAVHRIQDGNSTVVVNCLREPGAPISDCPLCQAKHGVTIGVYIKLIHDGSLKIWNRGKTFYDRIKNLCRRYKPLSAHLIEIERVGKKGDTNTSYDFYDIAEGFDKSVKSKDDLLADFSNEEIEKIEVFGNVIKDYSYEQLENYLNTGVLSDEAEVKVTRRNRKYVAPTENKERPIPSNNRRTVRKPITQIPEQSESLDDVVDEDEEVY